MAVNKNDKIGDVISAFFEGKRKELNLTKTALCEDVGITRGQYNNIINGTRGLNVVTLLAIVERLAPELKFIELFTLKEQSNGKSKENQSKQP